jgi:hypothetical protein
MAVKGFTFSEVTQGFALFCVRVTEAFFNLCKLEN